MTGFKQRAEGLRKRAEAVKAAPMFERANLAGLLVEDVAAFLVDLADRVDGLTPYLDEGGE